MAETAGMGEMAMRAPVMLLERVRAQLQVMGVVLVKDQALHFYHSGGGVETAD